MNKRDDGGAAFTVLFEGDIAAFKGNPFLTETPFGTPVTIGKGDEFAKRDALEAERDELRTAIEEFVAVEESDRTGTDYVRAHRQGLRKFRSLIKSAKGQP